MSPSRRFQFVRALEFGGAMGTSRPTRLLRTNAARMDTVPEFVLVFEFLQRVTGCAKQ